MKDIKKEIYDKFKNKYESIYSEKLFEDLYDSVSIQFPKFEVITNKADIYNEFIKNTIRPAKRRWINLITKNKKSIYNIDLDKVKEMYKKVENNFAKIESFEDFYNAKSVDEYKTNILTSLESFAKDDEKFLTDFEYLTDLSTKSVMAGFKNDIILFYLRNSMEELKEEEAGENVRRVIPTLADIPFATKGNVKFFNNNEIDSTDKLTTMDDVNLTKVILLEDDTRDNILLELEKNTYLKLKQSDNRNEYKDILAQMAILKSIKYLNYMDSQLINYIYNDHFSAMLNDESIDKSYYQILKEMGLPDTPYYHDNLEDSLCKLGSLRISYNDDTAKVYGSFFTCTLYKDKKKNMRRVEIIPGDLLKKHVVKNDAFEYDKETYDSLSSDAKQLAIWMQKRRYRLALNNKRLEETIVLKAFNNAIYFPNKNIYKMRTRIIAALEELKEKKLSIARFVYNKKLNTVDVVYLPLSIQEQRKLGLLEDSSYMIDPVAVKTIE